MNLRQKRAAALAKARAMQAKGDGGSLTADDIANIKALLAEVEALDEQITKADDAAQLVAEIGALGATPPEGTPTGNDGAEGAPKAARRHFFKSGNLGSSMLHSMVSVGGRKGLAASGSALAQIPLVSTDPLALPQTPTSVLDVLPVSTRATPTYEYLRQTERDIKAAFVPAGELKPTSALKVERVRNELHVLATLSEPLDKVLLDDNASLQNFVSGQLQEGLRHALEAEVLTGDGKGYTASGATYLRLTGLLNQSGIQLLHAGSPDRAITLRSAVDLLEEAGHTTSLYVVNAADWRAIETQRNASGTFDLGGIATRSQRTLWGIPVVTSAHLPAGTALALDTSAITLDSDGTLRVDWDAAGDLFTHNQIRARVEGRFGLSVYRPAGIVKVDLTK